MTDQYLYLLALADMSLCLGLNKGFCFVLASWEERWSEVGEWPGECNIYSLLRLHKRLLNSYSERYGTRKDVGRAVFKRDRGSGLREAASGAQGAQGQGR